MAIITAPVHWVKIAEPDTKYAPSWQVQVELTQDQVDKINSAAKLISKKAKDIKVFKPEDSDNYLWRLMRPVIKPDGTDNNPVKVVDRKNKPYTEDQLRQIGNGTTANIMYSATEYERNGGGVVHRLVGLQIVKLLKYEGAEAFKALDDDITPPSEDTGESFKAEVGGDDDY